MPRHQDKNSCRLIADPGQHELMISRPGLLARRPVVYPVTYVRSTYRDGLDLLRLRCPCFPRTLSVATSVCISTFAFSRPKRGVTNAMPVHDRIDEWLQPGAVSSV